MTDRPSRHPAAPVPTPVAYVRDLLHDLGTPWMLCGGWAVDAWLGRQTREHADVDIAVFHSAQQAIVRHFAGWALVAHDPNVPDDTTQSWNGRRLDLPAHIHVPTVHSPLATSTTATHPDVEFEFLLNEAADHHWILHRDLHVTVPLDRAVGRPGWGLPTAVPEVVLFFKAGGHLTTADLRAGDPLFRPRDEQDFRALLPALTAAQRSWLAAAIGPIHPEHPWLASLQSPTGGGPTRW